MDPGTPNPISVLVCLVLYLLNFSAVYVLIIFYTIFFNKMTKIPPIPSQLSLLIQIMVMGFPYTSRTHCEKKWFLQVELPKITTYGREATPFSRYLHSGSSQC